MKLIDYTANLFIIAKDEDTAQLETTLGQEGFNCQVLRQQLPEEAIAGFARSYLCLLNHRQAWQWIVDQKQPALIIEADFVPVRQFGQLPLPFAAEEPLVGIAWLYTCAPQVYTVSNQGHAQGFSTSLVAYVLTPQGAQQLLALADRIHADPGPKAYYPWDSKIDDVLLAAGLQNYIPFRNYGEHGSGNPNPEHRLYGLGRTHRADVLAGPLAFTPDYAVTQSFGLTRLYARTKGLGRLAMGRFVRPHMLRSSPSPLRLMGFALQRQLCWWL